VRNHRADPGGESRSEFAVEKKIVPIEWLPVDGCHLVEFAACAGFLALILPLRDAPFKKTC